MKERRINWGAEAEALGRWALVAASVCLIAAAFVQGRNRQVLAGQAIRDAEERIQRLRRRTEWHEIEILRLRERSGLRARMASGAGVEPVDRVVPLPAGETEEEP